MSEVIDVYWSFRSPYSYLATSQLMQLEKSWDIAIALKPVYPIAVRIDGFFEQVNPLWVPYVLKDTRRLAKYLDVPFRWPDPDPVLMDMETGKVPREQPHIHYLTRLGAAAAEADKGLAFACEISRVIWGGTKDWDIGNHLRDATARAGLDLGILEKVVENNIQKYEDIIQKHQKQQTTAGHWGVPLMVYKQEPFFGQDRINLLTWRLEQDEVARR